MLSKHNLCATHAHHIFFVRSASLRSCSARLRRRLRASAQAIRWEVESGCMGREYTNSPASIKLMCPTQTPGDALGRNPPSPSSGRKGYENGPVARLFDCLSRRLRRNHCKCSNRTCVTELHQTPTRRIQPERCGQREPAGHRRSGGTCAHHWMLRLEGPNC